MDPLSAMDGFALLCLGAAALPVAVASRNLVLYRSLPEPVFQAVGSVSVLIPARNEETQIQAAVESVLRCSGVELEVLVWDDASSDGTARVVRELEGRDARVRLHGASGPPPPGWAGKQYACARLAEIARGEVLIFLDADVRLTRSDALLRIAGAFQRSQLDFLSGVPSQRTGSWSESWIVPLIHFILLGFLPMDGMRRTMKSGFAAGCGQLIACRKSAYRVLGGHALVRGSFHEGIGLARAFRRAGRVTDLADLSTISVCRMYEGLGGVWKGFAKNAHEGLASRASLIPMSLLLLFGQVFPAVCLALRCGGLNARVLFVVALLCGLGLRAALALRFAHPWMGVVGHPFSVVLLLLNQWYGAFRHAVGVPVGWKGRTVAGAWIFAGGLAAAASGSEPVAVKERQKCPDIALEDQHGRACEIRFPRKKPVLIVVAGRRGTGSIAGWVAPVNATFGDSVEIVGLADVRSVPLPMRPVIRAMLRRDAAWPVLMDWSGKTVSVLFTPGLDTEVLVLRPSGEVEARLEGAISPEHQTRLLQSLRACGARVK
jgi:hypothetical protein